MSECATKQKITTKQIFMQLSGFIIGIVLATIIEKQGYPWIGWGVAGLFMFLGALFAYKTPEKRWSLKNISLLVLSIIGCSVIYNLIRTIEM